MSCKMAKALSREEVKLILLLFGIHDSILKKNSEKHYQSLLQLYLPYREMLQLKPPGFDLYRTFYESGYVSLEKSDELESVKKIVDANWAQFATNEQLLDEAQQVYESIGDVNRLEMFKMLGLHSVLKLKLKETLVTIKEEITMLMLLLTRLQTLKPVKINVIFHTQ